MAASLFGRRLKALREAKGWTLGDLWRAADGQVDRTYIGQLENGKRSAPSWAVACRLADALGVSLEAFRRAV